MSTAIGFAFGILLGSTLVALWAAPKLARRMAGQHGPVDDRDDWDDQ